MQHISRISQQTLWQFFGKIVTSLSTFFILGLVARNYNESGTGVFSLVLVYLANFYMLTEFGWNTHFLNQFQNHPQQATLFRKFLGVRIVWAVILMLMSVLTLPFWPFAFAEFNLAVMLGSLAIFGSSLFVTTSLVFQSKLRFDFSVIASNLGILLSIPLFIWLVDKQFPIVYLVLPHMLGWMIIGVIGLFLVKKFFANLNPIFSWEFAKELIVASWPVSITLVLTVIYLRADTFILSFFKSSAEVGIYNVAYQIFQTILVLPAFVMNAYYPLMIETFHQKKDQLIKQIGYAGLSLLILATLAVLVVWVLGDVMVTVLTGDGFMGATNVLHILALGFPGYFLSPLLMSLMVIQKKYKSLLYIYAVGLIFNLAANIYLIPQYSYYAAAWVSVLSEYLILSLQVGILVRTVVNHK